MNTGLLNNTVQTSKLITDGLKTGQSLRTTGRNEFSMRTGRVSPIRSASITALLSPREMVKEFTRRGSGGNDFGMEDYNMPKSGLPLRNKSGVIGKNKSPGPIESEARYRKQFPGSGAYDLFHDKTWTE